MSISDLYRAVNPVVPSKEPTPSRPNTSLKPSSDEFEKVLQGEQSVQLSKHAATRIRSRELQWSPELERRVSSGMQTAAKKGSRSALILTEDLAVIANIKSNTVVTAINRSEMKEHIFTNIDSAVLV